MVNLPSPPLLSLRPSPRLVCMHARMYPLCRSSLVNWVAQTKKQEKATKQQTDQTTNRENKHPSPCPWCVCVCSWHHHLHWPSHFQPPLCKLFSFLGTTTQMVGSSGCQVVFLVVHGPREKSMLCFVRNKRKKERKNHTTGHDPCFLASHKHHHTFSPSPSPCFRASFLPFLLR